VGSKPVKIPHGCPNCNGDAHEIWFAGNHGERELLETHCNACGWCVDSEGKIRSEGRILPTNIEQSNENKQSRK